MQHVCAQLASGLATSTGLDKVVFAKPEGRARIKSMERALLSAALPHRTGRTVAFRASYVRTYVRTSSPRRCTLHVVRLCSFGAAGCIGGIAGRRRVREDRDGAAARGRMRPPVRWGRVPTVPAAAPSRSE